jgi:hypothetical protein
MEKITHSPWVHSVIDWSLTGPSPADRRLTWTVNDTKRQAVYLRAGGAHHPAAAPATSRGRPQQPRRIGAPLGARPAGLHRVVVVDRRLMVHGEVRWRALLPTAIVMGIGDWPYTLAAALWMPADVTSQYAQFGAFGIAQSFVTWFTGMAFLLSVATGWDPRWSSETTRSPAGCDPGNPPPSKPTPHQPYPDRPGRSGYPTPSAAAAAGPGRYQRPHRRHRSNLNSSAASVLHKRSFMRHCGSDPSPQVTVVKQPASTSLSRQRPFAFHARVAARRGWRVARTVRIVLFRVLDDPVGATVGGRAAPHRRARGPASQAARID